MNIKYLQVAKEEFHDAIRYYETQQIGLGKSFQEEVKNSILRIKNFPLMYQITKMESENVYFLNLIIVFCMQ